MALSRRAASIALRALRTPHLRPQRTLITVARLKAASSHARRSVSLLPAAAAIISAGTVLSLSSVDVKQLIYDLKSGKRDLQIAAAHEIAAQIEQDGPAAFVACAAALVKAAGSRDVDVRRSALQALTSLAVFEEGAEEIIYQGGSSAAVWALKQGGVDADAAAILFSLLARPAAKDGKKAQKLGKEAAGFGDLVCGTTISVVAKQACITALATLATSEPSHYYLVSVKTDKLLTLCTTETSLAPALPAALAFVTAMYSGSYWNKLPAASLKMAIDTALTHPDVAHAHACARGLANASHNAKFLSSPLGVQLVAACGSFLVKYSQVEGSNLTDKIIEVRHFAMEALEAAAANASASKAILDSPTFEQIVDSISSSELKMSLTSMAICGKLAMQSSETACRLVRAHAIQNAVVAAVNHKKEFRARQILASFLLVVSKHAENERIAVAHLATPLLLGLLRVDDKTTRHISAEAFVHLSNNVFNKFALARNGVIPDFVDIISESKDIVLLRHITRTLAQMASTDNAVFGENAQELQKQKALRPLCSCILSTDPVVHRNATWAVAAMTVFSNNHEKMGPAIEYLVKVLRGGTLDAQRFAVLALANLAATEKTRDHLKERGIPKLLVPLRLSTDHATQQYALHGLSNIANNGTQVFAVPIVE